VERTLLHSPFRCELQRLVSVDFTLLSDQGLGLTVCGVLKVRCSTAGQNAPTGPFLIFHTLVRNAI
jgi:hypothetical protein